MFTSVSTKKCVRNLTEGLNRTHTKPQNNFENVHK